MIDDFESKGVRSSGELWSEICSNLPEPQDGQTENAQFTDSFQPSAQNSIQVNGNHSNSTFSPWEPMADSEIYIASLGTLTLSNWYVMLWCLYSCKGYYVTADYTSMLSCLQKIVWKESRAKRVRLLQERCCGLSHKQKRNAGTDSCMMHKLQNCSRMEGIWMRGEWAYIPLWIVIVYRITKAWC